MTATALPLRFQVGARTLLSLPRRLQRVALLLDDVLADRAPVLPPLEPDSDGLIVTSVPERHLSTLSDRRFALHVRQRYTRYHVDLTRGADGWTAALSANTRAGIRRKAKKLAAAGADGRLDIRRYDTAEAFACFHPLARAVSATTYQERLLDAGLPEDARGLSHLARLAAADALRAWLLFLHDRPIAYLCCTAEGDTLRYDHVGHDPAFSALSPGAVLQAEAIRHLCEERRFARFDFTEGEGQHKRSLATGGAPCADVLLLRPTPANRLALAALARFDAGVASARRLATSPALAHLAKRLRR